MDVRELAGTGGFLVVIALVEVVKRTWPGLEARWYPLLALVFGIALSEVVAAILATDPAVAGVTGLISGLMASGLYSGTKAVKGKGDDVGDRLEAFVPRG